MNNTSTIKGIIVDSTTIDYHYGLDISGKLTSMLSEELAKSIDAQIFQIIINQGRAMTRGEKIKSILDKIKSSE